MINRVTKIFDKCLNADLRNHLSGNFPDPNNFGGTVDHSPIGMFSELIEKVEQELANNPGKAVFICQTDLVQI